MPNVPWGQITSLENCHSMSLIVVLLLWLNPECGRHLYHTLSSGSPSLFSSVHQAVHLCQYYACISYGSFKAGKAKPSYCSLVNLSSAFIMYLFSISRQVQFLGLRTEGRTRGTKSLPHRAFILVFYTYNLRVWNKAWDPAKHPVFTVIISPLLFLSRFGPGFYSHNTSDIDRSPRAGIFLSSS